jgi:serine/threonine protein phosphatase 1
MRSAPDRGAGTSRPDARFARLRAARRVWAIAAVHGEAQRLAQLHDTISERFQVGDRVVYLGNCLGRSGAVRATIDELLDFRRRVLGRPGGAACDVVFLRGAREEMWQKLLQLQFAANPGELLHWMVRAGMETMIRAYGGDLRQGFAACRDGARTITRWTGALRSAMNATPGHTALFAALRHAAFTEDRGLLFVHAAVEPSRPLSEQRDAFWWGREDILELKEPFAGFRRIVRGVDRDRRGVVGREFAVSVDGGAGQGGRLIAACFGLDGAPVDIAEA